MDDSSGVALSSGIAGTVWGVLLYQQADVNSLGVFIGTYNFV